MATTSISSAEPRILITPTAWGYMLLPEDHPGVQIARERLFDPLTVPWDVLAEIAFLAGSAADDLIIAGGDACPILNRVRDALLAQAVAQVRTR